MVSVNGDINNDLPITTTLKYFEKLYPDMTPAEIFSDENDVELELVSNIISLQIAYYLQRRTSYICQSVSDHTSKMISRAKKAYRVKMGKDFIDLNEGSDY